MKWFGLRPHGKGHSRQDAAPSNPRSVDPNGEAQEAVFVEAAKVLQVKRWEVNEEKPFRGFGSTPGRF